MISRLVQIASSPKGRYVLVGGTVYGIELLVIALAQRAGYSSLMAVGLSFWVGLCISFVLQKFFTFRDRRVHHRVLLPQVIAVTLLVLFNFGFTLAVTQVLGAILPAVITRTLALGVTTLWNFYLYQTKIFKQSEPVPID